MPTEEDVENAWYSDDDYKTFKADRNFIREMVRGLGSIEALEQIPGITSLGLEHCISASRAEEIIAARQQGYEAVFTAFPAVSLAQVSQRSLQAAQQRARTTAPQTTITVNGQPSIQPRSRSPVIVKPDQKMMRQQAFSAQRQAGYRIISPMA